MPSSANSSFSTDMEYSFSMNKSSDCSADFIEIDDVLPIDSSIVKDVIKKRDSISYVLETEEDPEKVASRVLRRVVLQNFNEELMHRPIPKQQKCQSKTTILRQLSKSTPLMSQNHTRSKSVYN